MKSVPGYTKILAIGASMTENALVGDVIIQEKVDGSLFAFGMNEDGIITMRSKGTVQNVEQPDQMFTEAVEFVAHNEFLLKEGQKDVYYYCEYLQKPKHNTLKYDHIPKNHLVLFDILINGRWATRDELQAHALHLDIDAIPELYSGSADVEKIKSLLTTKSYLGDLILEGVVIKNYAQTIMLGGHVFPLFTKYVREEFKELHTVDWKLRQPKDSLADYVKSFAAEPRWQKALIHAREKGTITDSLQDIQPLLELIQKDIEEEEELNIKNTLYKMFRKDILRASTRGFVEWYKKHLLERLETK